MKSVLSKKVGIETPFFTNQAMLHGIKFEDVAVKIYEYRNFFLKAPELNS